MDFPIADIFGTDRSAEEEDEVDPGAEARQCYKARQCPVREKPEQLIIPGEPYSLKLAGDLALYQGKPATAAKLYLKVLQAGAGGAAVRRDAGEGRVRALLEQGEVALARECCNQLQGGDAGLLRLRVAVSRAEGAGAGWEAGALLCRLVTLHPVLARVWNQLADWYRQRGHTAGEVTCLIRAAKAAGREGGARPSVECGALEARLLELVDTELRKRIEDSLDRAGTGASQEDELQSETEDFVDLGSSARLRNLEESLVVAESEGGGREVDKDKEAVLQFEQKEWQLEQREMSDDERELDLDSDEEAGLDYSNLPPGQDKRAHHNALERKRRDHIKDSFSGLKDAIPTLQGDKSSRAQILKKASEYIAFMRRKNGSHASDIEDLKKQNAQLENQIKGLEKSKSSGSHYLPASASRHSSATAKEDEELEEEDLTDDTAGSFAEESSLHQSESEPERKKVKL